MPAETNLSQLLRNMNPRLHAGEYVFVTVSDAGIISRADTICEFKEVEGTTLVLPREQADQSGLSYEFVAAWITLEIHSSLDAVGLTAAFSSALAEANISCNVIAGYYHDHIFVPVQQAGAAVRVLETISAQAFDT